LNGTFSLRGWKKDLEFLIENIHNVSHNYLLKEIGFKNYLLINLSEEKV